MIKIEKGYECAQSIKKINFQTIFNKKERKCCISTEGCKSCELQAVTVHNQLEWGMRAVVNFI